MRIPASTPAAAEVVPAIHPDCPVLLTCEHASEAMPHPWRWPAEDQRLRGTHWAFDLGAAHFTRSLATRWGAAAVLARFSRLLVDPNRHEHEPDLIRTDADGVPVALNQGIDAAERQRRLDLLWRPFHETVGATQRASAAHIVFSVHSFTPVYEGKARSLEVGVLHDRDASLARRVHDACAQAGFRVGLNEPYSGARYMYSANRHADASGGRAIEIEIRQDLIDRPDFRDRLLPALDVLYTPTNPS